MLGSFVRNSILLLVTLFMPLVGAFADEQEVAVGEEAFTTSEGDDASGLNENDPFSKLDKKHDLSSAEQDQLPEVSYSVAKLIALNKITAKPQIIALDVGKSSYFGNIEIKVHKCFKQEDPYKPDNKILLTITDNKIDDDQAQIFQGWMISSSPSLSTLSHPVYEIIALECTGKKIESTN